MKSRGRVKYLIISIVSVMLIIVSIFFGLRNNKKEQIIDINNNNKMIAIMVEKENGSNTYKEYKDNSNWPGKGYKFSKAICYDKQRQEIKDSNIIEYDAFNNEVIMKSRKSAFCTLYFDIDNDAPISGNGIIEIASVFQNGDTKYTSLSKPAITIRIQDEDIAGYCVVLNKDDINSCSWEKVPSEREFTYNLNYSIVDNTDCTDIDNGNCDGYKTANLYLMDRARNTAKVGSDTIILDKTKPTITFTLDGQTAKYTCVDNTGGSGIPSGKESGSQALTGTSNYTYTISTCVDNAGNGADNASHTYPYDGCLTGSNTCNPGWKNCRCDDCYYGSPSECQSGYWYTTVSTGCSGSSGSYSCPTGYTQYGYYQTTGDCGLKCRMYDSCKSTKNTCERGCDSCRDECATGSNTCSGGFKY